jgi:hypothetical protein
MRLRTAGAGDDEPMRGQRRGLQRSRATRKHAAKHLRDLRDPPGEKFVAKRIVIHSERHEKYSIIQMGGGSAGLAYH